VAGDDWDDSAVSELRSNPKIRDLPVPDRGLEKRLGLQLLARTTRRVAPTAAGATLLRELTPALERIERALAETRKQKETPSGRIRLIIPRTATKAVILPKLAKFARDYPEIVLEVTSSAALAALIESLRLDG